MIISPSALSTLLGSIVASPVLVFGLLLMFGVAGGIVANRLRWMPTITAFMLLGTITGPYGIGIISKTMLYESHLLIDIALGLILYRLGSILHPMDMLRSKRLMLTSFLESFLSFLFVFLLLSALSGDIVLPIVVAAIAVSSSPAVLVHVADEVGATGPLIDRAKSLVAINNVFSFLIFSATMPIALSFTHEASGINLLAPLVSLTGSALIGIFCGLLATALSRFLSPKDEHFRFALVVGAIMLTIGLSITFNTSMLFAPLVLGMTTRATENERYHLTSTHLGSGADLFYIILFVMAGAKLDMSAVWQAGLIPLALVIARLAGKSAGLFFAARMTDVPPIQAGSVAMMLSPMAGMAIGLVATVNSYLPGLGSELSAIVFAMVAIFETAGPFAVFYGLRLCGEASVEKNKL